MKAVGTIKSIDIKSLKKYVLERRAYTDRFQQEEELFNSMYEKRVFPEKMEVRYDYGGGKYLSNYGESKHRNACRSMFQQFFKLWDTDHKESLDDKFNLVTLLDLELQYDYSIKYGQPLRYVYESDFGYYIESTKIKVFVPKEFVEVQPYIDYSNIPLKQIGANEDMNKSLPDVGEETQSSLKNKIEDKKAEIESKMAEIKAKEEEQKAEIEAMKKAIEDKYKDAFALMESKKAELELMMQQLEGQLFVLDTQIYGIRCFFGETVRFTQITSGKNAPVDTPVVMHQKIRFLDEELSKYAAIYNFDGEKTSMFEELLKHREDMRNLFFPEGKTVCLVRISRDGLSYKSGQKASVSESGVVSIYNVMESYEVYHGNQIAILVRNGENCYIGWTENDRISINDGNAFLTPKEAAVEDDADVKKDYFGHVVEEKTDKNIIAARFFIFSIVQGLIENSRLLELPEGTAVTQNSPYIVFSMAENWLSDNTYGEFDDIMEKCSQHIQKGDTILTLRNLSAEHSKYQTYCNDRGRGCNNRTHDVSARDNTLYKINLVEDDPYDNLVSYECCSKKDMEKGGELWEKGYFVTRSTEDDYMEDFEERHDTRGYAFRNIKFVGPDRHIFISLLKDNYWTDSDARANFELYRDEYLNLTFLNTVYLKYILTNRKMPRKYSVGANFSYIIPYLNTAMDYLKKREAEEEALISPLTALSEDWQVKLSEWKIEHNVHQITEYQAKRFAKWYQLNK